MAFPVPQHLPRKDRPQDVSSHILTKIGETSTKNLNSGISKSWILELEGKIQETKDRIYECIHAQLPEFERQLETSKSVQARLQNLSRNVDVVSNAFSNPETGLLPTLTKALTEHSTLAQRTSDAAVLRAALAHISQCRTEYRKLSQFVKDGALPQAVQSRQTLQKLLDDAPKAAVKAEVMVNLKRRLRIATDTTEEQLSDAYSRSVRISSTELCVSSHVQVRQSQTVITLQDLLLSLSPNSLSSHLVVLRRDIITHFISSPAQESVSFAVTEEQDDYGASVRKLSILPSPPNNAARRSTIVYFHTLFDFLSTEIFNHLPRSSRDSFVQSLYKPTIDGLLQSLLIPSLPSSLHDIPPFIALAKEAADFESALVDSLLGKGARKDLEIASWVDSIGSHYAKKRRVDILRDARDLVIKARGHVQDRIFRAEIVQEQRNPEIPTYISVPAQPTEEVNGWDFDDSANRVEPLKSPVNGTHDSATVDADAWDFEDEVAETEEPPPSVPNGDHTQPNTVEVPKEDPIDTEDAWGWGDEDGEQDADDDSTLASSGAEESAPKVKDEPVVEPQTDVDDSSAWDNAWGDDNIAEQVEDTLAPPPVPVVQPKVAKRLEKFSAKTKGAPSSSTQASPSLPSPSKVTNVPTNGSPPPSQQPAPSHQPKPSLHTPSPLTIVPPRSRPKETYSVTGYAKDIVAFVSFVLAEGRETHHSHIFNERLASSSKSSHSLSPGTLITQTASYVLDLYRALYPVAASAELSRYPDRAMRFSNDCIYISGEVRKIVSEVEASDARDLLHEGAEKTKCLGEWWYAQMVDKQRVIVRSLLEKADGFVDTGVQERFDECEAVMSDVLRNIRSVGSQWKLVLPRSKYFNAIGSVTESALTKVLEDILALGDIPELDSQKLCELCQILNALEGLFIDDSDPEMPSVVVAHVPSWLKFSYLSELLDATIADISYLFDQGALIDFEVDELVGLVRALFADTPLRTNTIAKLTHGHPVISS